VKAHKEDVIAIVDGCLKIAPLAGGLRSPDRPPASPDFKSPSLLERSRSCQLSNALLVVT
jgi:hypothetical protein